MIIGNYWFGFHWVDFDIYVISGILGLLNYIGKYEKKIRKICEIGKIKKMEGF